MQNNCRIGIDLGGTKIEGISLDGAGEEQFRQRVDTPQGDYQATLNAIKLLVEKAQKHLPEKASIGIGVPGAISLKTGFLKNSNSICLNGEPIREDLEKLIGQKVQLANDANCFALSESVDGAAAGAEIVFAVIVGTGCGAGVSIRQKILVGQNAIAGEWGHNPLPWANAEEAAVSDCYCGKLACVECFLSGAGFARLYNRAQGTDLNSKQIHQLAEEGHEPAELAFQQYEDRFARSLAAVTNILDPNVIVLGGGMSNLQRLYKNLPLLLSKYVFSDDCTTKIVQAKHGDSSGVRGAAWL